MTAPNITNAQLESIAQGLAALDGLNLKDGFVPFRFDDETTWQIAVASDAVQRQLAVFNAAKKSLAKQNGVTDRMPITKENAASVAAFMESLDVLLSRPVEIEIQPLSRAKLNVGQGEKKNAIPPGVLARLMPILCE